MRRWCLAALVLAPAFLSAQPQQPQPQGKLIRDDWETAYIDGYRVGYTRISVREFDLPGGKVLQAVRDLHLTVRRGRDVARMQLVTGSDETPDGIVLGVFMRQALSAQVTQELRGKVEGDQLRVKAVGKQANFDKTISWNPKVLGNLGELNILKTRKPKPGDKFEYPIYNPLVNAIATIRVKAEDFETVTIGAQRLRLLRLSAVPDEIGGVQLPSDVLWVDDAFEVRRYTTAMPGLGFLVVDRTNEETATRPLDPNQLPDIMKRQSIVLAQRVVNPHARSSITYRVTMPNDKEPAKTFAQDVRQTVGNVKGNTFDLTVTAVRQPPAVAPVAATNPGKEYTESNFFITSDDDLVKRHAREAVNGETDPWRKALAIERWVKQNMKVVSFTEAMAPAAEVAKTLSGDCTEHAMLAAAMCRVAGVPSRTAIGLVYVDTPPPEQPLLGFHMWTEVFVRGQWVAIDPIMGEGSVGPDHVKITDAHWHDTRSMTPLLPVMRVMIGRPAVQVVNVVP